MKSAFAGSGAPGLVTAINKVERHFLKSGKSGRVVRILSVDPGEVTGVSVLWVWGRSHKIAAWAETLLAHEELRQVSDLLGFVRLLSDGGATEIVLEDFRVMRIAMEESFLSPVRIGRRFEWGVLERAGLVAETLPDMDNVGWHGAGAVAAAPWLNSVRVHFVFSSEMAAMADNRLKALGFYTPGPDHRRDATRHALLHWKAVRGGLRDWPFDKNNRFSGPGPVQLPEHGGLRLSGLRSSK